MENLPTNTTGLIAFLVVTFIGAIVWMMRYFIDYIQKKNGNLERVSETFAKTMENVILKHNADRVEWMQKLQDCYSHRS